MKGVPSEASDEGRRVRAALNETTRRSFMWTCLGLGIAFVGFITVDAMSLPGQARRVVPWVDAGLSAFFFSLFLAFRKAKIPAAWANPAGGLVVAVALANGLFLLWITRDPLQTFSFLLILFGAGFFFLSWPWFLATLLATTASWIVVALRIGWGDAWSQYLTALLAAGVISLAAHAVRLQTYVRLETLRLRDEAQKMALQAAADTARKAEEATRLAVSRLVEIERLKEINQFRTEFLNRVSHELNTPLTPIKLQIHMLRSAEIGSNPEALRRSVDVLDRNVDRLKVLVDEVVQAARIQEGSLKLRLQPTDLPQLLTAAEDRWRPACEAAKVQLVVGAQPVGDVLADRDRLGQVLDHLLSNALKYTSPGGRVAMRAEMQGLEAVVRVIDDGAGIKPEDQPRLFQPFSQLGPPRSAAFGTGLGLYLSKAIVELHGGRIWCRSEGPGRGSEFGFSVPRSS